MDALLCVCVCSAVGWAENIVSPFFCFTCGVVDFFPFCFFITLFFFCFEGREKLQRLYRSIAQLFVFCFNRPLLTWAIAAIIQINSTQQQKHGGLFFFLVVVGAKSPFSRWGFCEFVFVVEALSESFFFSTKKERKKWRRRVVPESARLE